MWRMSPTAQALLAEITSDPAALRDLAGALALHVPLPAESAADGWISTRGAAAYLGMSSSALNNLTAARRVPFEQDRPGGKCWFKRSDLDAWRRGQWQP